MAFGSSEVKLKRRKELTTTYESISDLSNKIDLSTAMLYRAIDELKDMDLITTEDGLKLTDAGKIARL